MFSKSQCACLVVILAVLFISFIPQEAEGSITKAEVARVKRGYHGGGGHGHGPGAGGGAAGPVYFCGWVGKGEGYRGYGHGK